MNHPIFLSSPFDWCLFHFSSMINSSHSFYPYLHRVPFLAGFEHGERGVVMRAHGPGALPIDAAAGTLLEMVARLRREDVPEVGVAADGGCVAASLRLRRRLHAAQRRLAHEAARQRAAPIVEEDAARRSDDQIGQDAIAMRLRTRLFGEPGNVEGGRLRVEGERQWGNWEKGAEVGRIRGVGQ